MNRGFPQRIWVAYMNLTADSIIGVSKRTALDYGARTTVIENGVQIDEVLSRFEASDLERVRLEFDVGDQDFVLSCIGTLQASKGHHVLVGALAILARRFPERRFRVFLVGPKLTDPDFAGYTALLEGQISRLRLSGSIHLTGFRSDYLSFVKLADICVHPVTMADSYPAAVRDPMLCGRPVVATACGGIPEMIENGRTGLLVPANDTEALAEAISRIIDSPGFGRELVLNAREFAEEAFDARRMARQTEALYADVLDR
jgi:glycosyltransferase involved in cell wall biosynthesis